MKERTLGGLSFIESEHPMEDDDDQRLCPVISAPGRIAIHNLFCACPPRFGPARTHLAALISDAWPVLTAFAESTSVYVISKQWADTISVYALRLHQRPFCEPSGSICGEEAPAWQQLLYALCLLLVLAPLHRLANLKQTKVPFLRHVLTATPMWLGWAMGDASMAVLSELDRAGTDLAACISCNAFNICFVFGVTGVTALIMVVVSPRVEGIMSSRQATNPVPSDPHTCCDSLRHNIRSVPVYLLTEAWLLLSRGLKYNVMILWTFVSTHTIKWGVSAKAQSGPVFGRLLVTYAISLTTVLALAVVIVIRFRTRIEALPLPDVASLLPAAERDGRKRASSLELPRAPPSLPPSPSVEEGSDATPRVPVDSRTPLAASSSAHEVTQALRAAAHADSADQEWLLAALKRLELVMLQRAAIAQVLVLLEAAMGWTTGSAWTDAVVAWSPLSEQPTWPVILKDIGVAAALTAVMLTWLTFVGGEGTKITTAKREVVERYFLTNAGSFVVGWSWVVVLRDLAAGTVLAIETAYGKDPSTTHLAFFTEAATIVLFGPLVTILLVAIDGGVCRKCMRCCLCSRCSRDNTNASTGQLRDEARSDATVANDAAPPPPSTPWVAIDGGGQRNLRLGRLLRKHGSSIRAAAVAPGGCSSHRQALLPAQAPAGGAMAPSDPPTSSGLHATRASLREQLLADLIEADPALADASNAPSRIASQLPSRVPSQPTMPFASVSLPDGAQLRGSDLDESGV